MLQHPLLEVVSVGVGEPQADKIKVSWVERLAWPVAAAEGVFEVLAEEVAEAGRVGLPLADPEPETVAVLGARTVVVPVGELVVVFETLRLRVSVGEPVEVRELARLTVVFAECVDVFVPIAERVLDFEPKGVAVTVGVEVSVRDAFMLAVSDDEPVDVFDGAKVPVPVRLPLTVGVKGGE